MLTNDLHAIHDRATVRSLVDQYGWALMASTNPDGSPIVSHLPVVLDPAADDCTILGHVARIDADEHHLGERDVVIVIEGVQGYVSPTLYGDAGPYVPTWNFVVLHLHGRPQVLDEHETWNVLQRTVAHFERDYTRPWDLRTVDAYAQSLRPHVTGFRLRPSRVVTKAKLSQDKPREVVQRVIAGFAEDGEYANPALARAMRELADA